MKNKSNGKNGQWNFALVPVAATCAYPACSRRAEGPLCLPHMLEVAGRVRDVILRDDRLTKIAVKSTRRVNYALST